ncbi:DUF805 domain-containing protein [Caulobacter sp. RHG1]|uniref:DUF805 domain-containing protein n=1 Tax=Caulobacter sp. (strain RHG1) TaxID=2545762 RepID=UPI001554DFF7|nr:DUF805 domain-containing protein [Caulobacter sp. RHG1]NQE64549.1 hypothetical protein [Caulobacter sp. RHG1]
MDWKTLFLSPEGRIGRQAFWIGWLVLLGVNVVAGWLPLIGWAISLATIYASVCIHSKRLHDMGQTGWWQVLPWVLGPILVFGAVASVGLSALGAAFNGGEPSMAMLASIGGLLMSMFIAFAVWLAFTLWVGCSTGLPGDNKYGAAPINTAAVVL